MEFHPLADMLPLLEGDEYDALVDDIRDNGQLEAIWTYEGKILDGRNRWRACQSLGIDPKIREWEPQEGQSAVAFVVSLNLRRRHLSPGQLAMIALEVEKQLALEAKKNLVTSTGGNEPEPLDRESFIPIHAAAQAAQMVGSNHQYIVHAKKIAEQAPDVAEEVRAGRLTIPRAMAEISRRENAAFMEGTRDIRVPEGKFRTIVIDPPWPMEKMQLDAFGPNQAGFDYPTMTIDEIINFEVPADVADEDCHLFLWTTQKFLPDAINILEMWNFNYVFCMTWVKTQGMQPIGLPKYNSEFVLYGRRGTPKFLETSDFKTAFEGRSREHSRKPEEFYNTLRRVTPGPRIDIFSRSPIEGFDQYGNEPEKFQEVEHDTAG